MPLVWSWGHSTTMIGISSEMSLFFLPKWPTSTPRIKTCKYVSCFVLCANGTENSSVRVADRQVFLGLWMCIPISMILARHLKVGLAECLIVHSNFLLLIFLRTLFLFPKLEATPESTGSSISLKNMDIWIGSVGVTTVIPKSPNTLSGSDGTTFNYEQQCQHPGSHGNHLERDRHWHRQCQCWNKSPKVKGHTPPFQAFQTGQPLILV